MPRIDKEKNLTKLWNLESAEELNTFTLNRKGDSLEIVVGNTYLFVHSRICGRGKLALDDYWKGLVVGIKTVGFRADALLQVRWYWSKDDIEASIKGLKVDKRLKEILNVCNRNELFPGKELVINTTDSIEWEVDVVSLKDEIDQVPVVEYFFRLGWDEGDQTFHGPPYGCGKPGCDALWWPEEQEQRYCFQCSKWYHISCLSLSNGMMQSKAIELAVEDLHTESPPPAILAQVAFQPAARGGIRHFTAGNIRIVKKARDLIFDHAGRTEWTGGNEMTEEEWISSMEDFFGMSETDRGNVEREQLVVGNQNIYECAICSRFV